jgi:hypothetical protein
MGEVPLCARSGRPSPSKRAGQLQGHGGEAVHEHGVRAQAEGRVRLFRLAHPPSRSLSHTHTSGVRPRPSSRARTPCACTASLLTEARRTAAGAKGCLAHKKSHSP